MKKLSLLFGAMLVVCNGAQSEIVKIQLPPETQTYKNLPGADLANSQCLTCHSSEYVSLQPPLARAFWKDAVDKMISKYGAPVLPEHVEPLADYLVKAYGNEATNAAASVVAQAKPEAAATFDAAAYVAQGCAPCHDGKVPTIPAPLFKDVAKKYAGRADAMDKVSHQILNGGSGQWGTFPMPAFTDVSPEQVKKLADWILAQE